MNYSFGLVLFLALNPYVSMPQLQEQCASDKTRFERMNRPMFIGPKATAADVAAYEKNKDSATETLHQFLVRSILSELDRAGPENAAAKLAKWMDCVQSGIPEYALGKRLSNTPTAYFLPGVIPRIALIYSIDRGYEAVSQFTYFFEIYSLEEGAWKLIASETPHQFCSAPR